VQRRGEEADELDHRGRVQFDAWAQERGLARALSAPSDRVRRSGCDGTGHTGFGECGPQLVCVQAAVPVLRSGQQASIRKHVEMGRVYIGGRGLTRSSSWWKIRHSSASFSLAYLRKSAQSTGLGSPFGRPIRLSSSCSYISRIFCARSASGDASRFDGLLRLLLLVLLVLLLCVVFAGRALHSARNRASRACFPSLSRNVWRLGGSGGFGDGSWFNGGKSGGGWAPERVFSNVWRRDGGIRGMC